MDTTSHSTTTEDHLPDGQKDTLTYKRQVICDGLFLWQKSLELEFVDVAAKRWRVWLLCTGRAGWGQYRIEGSAFVYSDRDSRRITTILGYPTYKIAQVGRSEISNLFS